MLEISVLGGFCVHIDGREIPGSAWRRRKSAAIVKILALAPGHRMHREQMMDLLWPELDSDQAANSLYQALHSARRALGVDDVLVLRDQIVQLNGDIRTSVDVLAFETAAETARKRGSQDGLKTAIDLYTGDLLPDDRYEPWAVDRREALRDEYVSLVLDLAELYGEAGDDAGAIALLRRVVGTDPLHEPAQRALMAAYARSGQRQLALRQYQVLLETLVRELDVDPEPETRELVERIRDGEVAGTSRPRPVAVEGGPEAPRHNLPESVSRFIGRASEKEEVSRLLASTRLLTLTGPGGSGKSRLSLEVARGILDEYPDGVWLVELAALSDPDLIPYEIASTLEIRDTASQPVMETVRLWLRSRRLLIVLDNCEHLVDACARIVEALLRSTPGLKVLATSREPLRIDGEVTWLVPSLSLPDPQMTGDPRDLLRYEAVQLFIDRATSISPGFSLTYENAGDVAQICNRLDGIPLAIELAAARARALSAGQIVERLSDRFSLLGGGSRSGLSRQQTLRAALDWSYDLLSEPERVLFARLSIFSGGFRLEAVEAICSISPLDRADIVDLLAQLVDRSLVVTGQEHGATRYWLLETMREYARERLDDRGEGTALRGAFVHYFAGRATQSDRLLRGGGYDEGYSRFEFDHDNLRMALDWYLNGDGSGEIDRGLELAASLHWFWHISGHFSEGINWLCRLLDASSGEPSRGLAYAHTATAILYLAVGEYDQARRHMTGGIRLWRELDDLDGLALAVTWAGWIDLFQLQ
ncbi:MAG TPA: BTAD domain-containing putative transcriptional regulator, partial [Thermomicrobiales bacterium]|nr:BTAD domain-containing putative transcriptional regulator [Thermomicrobiales bacterium]